MTHVHRWLIGTGVVLALAAALALIAAGGGASLAEDGIIYVDADAPGPTHNGESWETAYTDLQTAIDIAIAEKEIWVAAGVYTPTVKYGGTEDRNRSFQMKNEVAIYGGFAGTETERGQRDWDANPTILSGDLNGDDGPDFANRDDNSYHVFYHPSQLALDSTAILDGFTITGGNGNGGSWPHYHGGGMFNEGSSPTLANCTFDGSEANYGGAMYNWDSAPVLLNCTFEGNSANNRGGAMYNHGSSTLIGCAFTGNSADEGGGMYNWDSAPALTDCTFSDNSASVGGGMYNQSSLPELTGCAFTGNSAAAGGGMYNQDSSPMLANCTFLNNSSTSLGGGMLNYRSSTALTNCTFTGNSTDVDGGGMSNVECSPTLTNCTFTGNSATHHGGGMYNDYYASPTLTNCILWGNTSSEIYNYDSTCTPDVTYSDIQGGYTGEGNIGDDPLFVDAAGGDLRLQRASLAIDSGNNDAPGLAGITTDLGGNPRFAGVIDMGAYEAPPERIFVDLEAAGDENGGSWEDALTNLQGALAWAQEDVEIWVAAGIYKPTWQFDSDDLRSATFQMKSGVAIYGGFDPSTGDTAWEDRSWASNETILSGDIGEEDKPDDNSYHVFNHPDGSDLDSTAILDGFTVSGGNANGTEPYNRGGGMVNWGQSPTLANCTFRNNSAEHGGGIYNDEAQPTLTNCTFVGNSASRGGGMSNNSSSPRLTNCTFSGNSAVNDGGGMLNDDSSPFLTNCTFSGNSADTGGGMSNWISHPVLVNCILWGDTPREIFDADSSPIITYSDIQGSYSGVGNIDADPLFLDAADGDFHLHVCSPCIDAGDNTPSSLPLQDFEGDGRVVDGNGDGEPVVDMGVDEVTVVQPCLRVYLPLVLKAY